MTDHSTDAARSPDYELADSLALETPEQYKALFDEVRQKIVTLLLDRAATTSELAEVLGIPKGTAGHHVKVLEAAGLLRVVRTKKVRALEAKYYGRTARVFWYDAIGEAVDEPQRALSRAAAEIAQLDRAPRFAYTRQARIPEKRADEFGRRLVALLDEFMSAPSEGEDTYAMVVSLYPTRGLRDDAE